MALSFNDDDSLFKFVVTDGNGVKGLVDSGIMEVPGRYIQPPHERIPKQQSPVESPETMTIDLSELDGPNHDQVVKAIAHAAETLGFFQVVNHGVPLELLDSLKVAANKFFNQPVQKKVVYLKGASPSPNVVYTTSFAPKLEKVLEWKDIISMNYTNDADALEFWPNECKEAALDYIKTSKEMVKRLFGALMANLDVILEDSRIDTLLGTRMVNMNFYPPCPNPDLTVGVGRHSDVTTLTILLQDDIGGLYVKKDENLSPQNTEWVDIPPIHGALVVNIGDTLQILSNGRYKSAEHRVRTTSTASRVSVPLFIFPVPEEKLGPFSELVARDGMARYKELIFQEYIDNFYGNPHEGKKCLEFASI